MKKTLFALAGCGLFASASAQSSVTIYGIVDLAIAKLNGGDSVLTGLPTGLIGAPNTLSLRPSTSNRLGFRGSEDLGGGWRASFSLEHRFAADTGTLQFGQTGFFGGHSWVGLGNVAYGEVRLGRQFVPAHYVAVAGDPWGFDYNVGSAYGFTKGGSTFTYAANAASYRTPKLNGFIGEVVIGLAEGGAAAGPANNPDRTWSAALSYDKDRLYVGIGHSKVRTEGSVKNEFTVVTASYDFGAFKPMASYSVGRPNTERLNRAYLVGVVAPIGAGRLKAVLARLDPAGDYNNTTKIGLGYEHFLSKRTSVHADVGTASTQGRHRSNGIEAGIKHVF